MKKVLKYGLIVLNVLIILSLLALSGMLLYFSNTESPSLFGRSAVLQRNGEETENILLLYENRTSRLSIGDTLLLRSEKGALSLYTVVQVENSVPYYSDSENRFIPVDLTSPEYLGTVVGESEFLGEIAANLSKPGNLLLTYLIIGGCFLFCLLILMLIYFLGKRSEPPVLEDETDLLLLKELLVDGDEESTKKSLDITNRNSGEDEESPRAITLTKSSPFMDVPSRRIPQTQNPLSPKRPLSIVQRERHRTSNAPQWSERPSASSPSAEEERLSDDLKLYTPPQAEPTAANPPNPEIVIHTYTETAYDLYDAQIPSIDDILNDIEKQFQEVLDDEEQINLK